MKIVCLAMVCMMMFPMYSGNTNLVQSSALSEETASLYLGRIMDQFHTAFDVYTDSHAAGNHFAARGRMPETGTDDAIPPMNEAFPNDPHGGITCIEAKFRPGTSDFGGWYLMNGVLLSDESAPRENWGDYRDAGIDLRGATELTFWARGANGGERVEFFAFGVGRNPETGIPNKPYPDSSPKISTGYVTLSPDWRLYRLDVSRADLSYVLGGFGWVTNAAQNNSQDVTFYVDDIQYNKARLYDPRFLVSYETISSENDFDMVMRNVAFTYDNAVALLAFLASGEKERAGMLADALVYAQQHDRFYEDGRIRNAYQGGDLVLPPGWTPNGRIGTVRMPGWYDGIERQWFEDEYQVSTSTGNVAWAMLALLAYYDTVGGSQYLAAAEQMGEWVERNCFDSRGAGGYTAGFEGWESSPTKLMYKSTEHSIDLYAAFLQLYLITGNEVWLERANHAKQFVLSMWDAAEEKFWTGTGDDGVTTNTEVVPLDIQAWAVLALREDGELYWGALEYAETHHRVGDGFDFNEDHDGIWYEGTAQMAAAYLETGQRAKWQNLVSFLRSTQSPSGGLAASDTDGLTTGFYLPDGQPWLYFLRVHVGATSWLVLSGNGVNPFYPVPAFSSLTSLFSSYSFFVVGNDAYCTDVLGSAKIAFGLGQGGVLENPEGRTDLILPMAEHDAGNLMIVGGPAINPVAVEFDGYFGITYNYVPGSIFEIFADDRSISLDLGNYPEEDICIVYLAQRDGRSIMLVWGYGWRGTYAGSVIVGNPPNWQLYSHAHMLFVRWIDSNVDGLVQENEITVEDFS